MPSRNIFNTKTSHLPKVNTVNEAGGTAYKFSPKHTLAQLAVTGTFEKTYYTDGEAQLDKLKEILPEIEPEFIAKCAVYSRRRGFMKDMPAFLLAYLSTRHLGLFERIFPKVVNNARMLRGFVQIVRSGAVGRRSFGSCPKRLIRKWVVQRDLSQLFRDSIGEPSMGDIIKMVHPKPKSKAQEALFGYLIGSEVNAEYLPDLVKEFEAFKASPDSTKVPDVPFMLLTGVNFGEQKRAIWKRILENASWQQTRINLNTFKRHGVFDDPETVELAAKRLSDRDLILRAKAFPFQVYATLKFARYDHRIEKALLDALEVTVENIPEFEGNVLVFPDVSASMGSPITGERGSASSRVQCVDAAGLFAACILKKNKNAVVWPFDTRVYHWVRLSPFDTVYTNAEKIAGLCGGSTAIHAPLEMANDEGLKGDLVIYISDNESWVGSEPFETRTIKAWDKFKRRNPNAKLVCIDIQPTGSTQAPDDPSILNIGGFSDSIFEVIRLFATGSPDHWVEVIENERI